LLLVSVSMDPQAEIKHRLNNRELRSGRDRQPRRERQAGGVVKSEKNDAAAAEFEAERAAWKARNAAKGGGSSGSIGGVDEEEAMIQKGKDLQQQNRESLANTLSMAKAATEVGQETLMKLAAQKEQMKKMDEDLDKTNESLNRSERVIRGMKSTLGGIRNFFTKPKEHVSERLGDVKSAVEAEEEKDDAKAAKQARSTTPTEETPGSRPIPLSERDLSSETEKTRAALNEFQENQKVEDQQLDEIGDLLGQLKGQAKDMRSELKQQTVYTDHLDSQITKTAVRVKSADHNVKQIS